MDGDEIASSLGKELRSLLLLGGELEPAQWEEPVERADSLIAFASFLTPLLEEHASVVFPAESNAEKEGTLTHPDGRLQRVRQAIGHADQVRATWSVLAELCLRLGTPVDAHTAPMVTAMVAEAVPFYRGLTLEEIGGHGVRWQERDAASAAPQAEAAVEPLAEPPSLVEAPRLGAVPSLWSGPEVEHSPVLQFLAPAPRAELSIEDARRLAVDPGDEVEVTWNGHSVRARAAVRSGVPPGNVFLGPRGGAPATVEVRKA